MKLHVFTPLSLCVCLTVSLTRLARGQENADANTVVECPPTTDQGQLFQIRQLFGDSVPCIATIQHSASVAVKTLTSGDAGGPLTSNRRGGPDGLTSILTSLSKKIHTSFDQLKLELLGKSCADSSCGDFKAGKCSCLCSFPSDAQLSLTSSSKANHSCFHHESERERAGLCASSCIAREQLEVIAATVADELSRLLQATKPTTLSGYSTRIPAVLAMFNKTAALIGGLQVWQACFKANNCSCAQNTSSRCIDATALSVSLLAASNETNTLALNLHNLGVIAELWIISYKLGTIVPAFWPSLNYSWPMFRENMTQVFCNSLTPRCRKVNSSNSSGSSLKVCNSMCEPVFILKALVLQLGQVGGLLSPSLARLINNLHKQTCSGEPGSLCLDLVRDRIATNQPSVVDVRKAPQAQCISPLIYTSDKNHYIPSVRTSIRKSLEKTFNMTFNVSNDVIDGLFPCGLGCMTPGHTKTAHDNVQIVAAVVSWLVFLSSMTACIIYVLKSRAEQAPQALHKRLVLCFNVNCLMLAITTMPASFKHTRNLYCHGDGTLRRDEPDSSFFCSLFGAMTHIGMLNNSFLLACLAHQWLTVVQRIRKTSVQSSTREQQSKLFRIYLALCWVPTVILVSIMLGLREINGSPLTGTCGPGFDNLFYLLTLPVTIATTVAVIFLLVGISTLFPVWKKAQRLGNVLRNRSSSVEKKSQPPHRRASRSQMVLHRVKSSVAAIKSTGATSKALQQLMVLLLVYVLSSMAMASVHIAFGIIVEVNSDLWANGLYESLACRTLNPDSKSCKAVPRIGVDIIVALLVVFGAAGIILSTWVASRDIAQKSRKNTRRTPSSASNKTMTSLDSSRTLSSSTNLQLNPVENSADQYLPSPTVTTPTSQTTFRLHSVQEESIV